MNEMIRRPEISSCFGPHVGGAFTDLVFIDADGTT